MKYYVQVGRNSVTYWPVVKPFLAYIEAFETSSFFAQSISQTSQIHYVLVTLSHYSLNWVSSVCSIIKLEYIWKECISVNNVNITLLFKTKNIH